jgi:CelD/BcsL family acetyltransferase involved in cellulose biosynthesis
LSVHFKVVESLDSLEAVAPAWQALDEQTFPRLPFTGPLWNILWWKHLARSRLAVSDRIHAFLLFDDAELLAVAPMMLTERPARGMLRARQLQFFGADPNLTEVRGPCCRRDNEGRVFEALLAHLKACANDWDWVELSGFVEHGQAHRVVSRRTASEWIRRVPDFLIQPSGDWETYRKTLPRNLKESLRKGYATLRRDNLRHELRVAERPSEMKERVDKFFELHSLRARAPITPRHADVFAARPSRSFLREYLMRASETGSAKLFELLVEGKVVASRIGFVLNDNLYLYYSGYHPAMSGYSVMTTCVAETIKWAIENGLKTINLSTGRDQSKLRWRPIEVPLVEVQWVAPSWRGAALHGLNRSIKKRTTEDAALAGTPALMGRIAQLLRR